MNEEFRKLAKKYNTDPQKLEKVFQNIFNELDNCKINLKCFFYRIIVMRCTHDIEDGEKLEEICFNSDSLMDIIIKLEANKTSFSETSFLYFILNEKFRDISFIDSDLIENVIGTKSKEKSIIDFCF